MRLSILLPLMWIPFPLIGQIDAQRFTSRDDGGRVVVSLTERVDGSVTGTLIIDDVRYPITARYDGDRIVGSVRTERYDLYLEAAFEPGALTMILMDLDRNSQPRPTTAQRFYLESDAAPPPRTEAAPDPRSDDQTTGPLRNVPYLTPGAGPLGVPYALDPMLGRFSDGYVHLDLFGANGRYDGSLTITGTTYPVRLTRNRGGEFEGGYWIEGVEYPLVVALTSNGVSAMLDGQLRLLPRTAPAAGYGTAAPVLPGRSPYGPGPGLSYPNTLPFNDAYLTEWFNGKAIYFPDPLSRSSRLGIMSRRVLHLCYEGELEVEDRDVITEPVRPPGGRIVTEPVRSTGTWQLYWDDITLDLEIRFDGRTERYEMNFSDTNAIANGEPVLIGYSDRCG